MRLGQLWGVCIVTKEAWIYPKLRNMFPVGIYVQTEYGREILATGRRGCGFCRAFAGRKE